MAKQKGNSGRHSGKRKGQSAKRPVKNPTPIRKSDAKPAVANGIFLKSVYIILATICIALLFARFFELNDISNDFLKEHKSHFTLVERISFLFLSLVIAFYGYLQIFNIREKKYPEIALGLSSFVVIVLLYIMAFNPVLGNFGDNASYVINAKALVERGGAYYMHLPSEPPYPKAAIGLPMLLSPVYYFFGIDIIKMKWVVFFTGVLAVLFVYLLFSQLADRRLAAVLAILYGIHPFIVFNTSTLMTEIPYLFWSITALWLVLKYERSSSFGLGYLILMMIALFMTYMTRTIGISTFAAVLIYLFLKLPFPIFKTQGVKEFIKTASFKKFFTVALLLLVVLVGWQMYGRLFGGESHAEALAARDLTSNFKKNYTALWQVFSQGIFAENTVRWHLNPKNYKLFPMSNTWVIVLLLTGIGLIRGLYRKQLISYYLLAFIGLLLLASGTSSVMVMSRYLIPLTPFMIFYFFAGIIALFELINLLIKSGSIPKFAGISGFILFLVLAYSSMSGTSKVILDNRSGPVYKVGYENFISAAAWCKENTPDTSYILSRKPRIFYMYSDRKGSYNTTYKEKYSKEFEAEKLAKWKEENVDYLILDAFNSSTRNNIYPIVQNNPDKFNVVNTIGTSSQCYIVKVKPY